MATYIQIMTKYLTLELLDAAVESLPDTIRFSDDAKECILEFEDPSALAEDLKLIFDLGTIIDKGDFRNNPPAKFKESKKPTKRQWSSIRRRRVHNKKLSLLPKEEATRKSNKEISYTKKKRKRRK